jgi:hypothetical protein
MTIGLIGTDVGAGGGVTAGPCAVMTTVAWRSLAHFRQKTRLESFSVPQTGQITLGKAALPEVRSVARGP